MEGERREGRGGREGGEGERERERERGGGEGGDERKEKGERRELLTYVPSASACAPFSVLEASICLLRRMFSCVHM